jgi:hypothetical protein
MADKTLNATYKKPTTGIMIKVQMTAPSPFVGPPWDHIHAFRRRSKAKAPAGSEQGVRAPCQGRSDQSLALRRLYFLIVDF